MTIATVFSYVKTAKPSGKEKILAVYLHPVRISDEQLDEMIAPILSTQGPFDALHFTGAPEQIATVQALLVEDTAVRARLSGALHPVASKVVLISWKPRRFDGFNAMYVNGAKASDQVIADERQFGLFEAFTMHGGLVTAGSGTHFTKPSGTHSSQFLRAANVLEGHAVAHRLAFWLYPLLTGKVINRIVVDTSGISTVAFGLAYERLMRGEAPALPIIETHASYGGLSSLIVPDPEGTIFLVSASTSGKLVEQLVQKGAIAQNVFTLFFLGDKTPGTVVCDLTAKESIGFPGLQPIVNHDASNCPACIQHSYAIPIVGDQFRTEPAEIAEITITLSDFDEPSRAILDRLVSTGLFKIFRKTTKRSYEIYLDVEAVLTKPPTNEFARIRVSDLRTRLDRLLRRGMPVHLKRIVPTAYPGAAQIANIANKMLPGEADTNVSIVASQNLLPVARQNEPIVADPDSATLVISGCLDDTYELMAISRDLRTVQPGGSITYISPFFRGTSNAERTRIESNLTFGDQGPKTFSLFSVVAIDLPHCSGEHSWEREFRLLQEVEYWCDLNGEEMPAELERRQQILAAAPAIGMSDELFWGTPFGQSLKLAADFTMIPTDDGKRPVSQADVYVIVSSLFHKYRSGIAKKPKLVSKSYERAVISPESFQRFSDGVLQAAFLRAARGGELAYANCSEDVSSRMLDFLCVEVKAVRNGAGPALMEFLIAMLDGRLSLHEAHQQKFLRLVIDSQEVPAHIKLIARYMEGLSTQAT
ncbi:hypothetical protein JAB6_13550 [Janthinobacterium sp. HH104]|uniref:hypothetical protein n=1 Tax=Janthinobacterium sp. HH104 TaxID=1537276 RepID=UPI00089367EB|nr:hypothetical protein [Janthinobacterium sp. HH104]OEZ86941.1 hypothetical protein JAB6_13550 [Janthinobacterium sp. HH104]